MHRERLHHDITPSSTGELRVQTQRLTHGTGQPRRRWGHGTPISHPTTAAQVSRIEGAIDLHERATIDLLARPRAAARRQAANADVTQVQNHKPPRPNEATDTSRKSSHRWLQLQGRGKHHERLVHDIMTRATNERPATPSNTPSTTQMMATDNEPNITNRNGDRRPSIPATTNGGLTASIEELAHLHGAAAAQAGSPDATTVNDRLKRITKRTSIVQATGDTNGTSAARDAALRKAALIMVMNTSIELMIMVQTFWP